mgnify:CR=1 FL=1
MTSNVGRGGRRYLPLAFTEHGAIMAASVLNSSRAIEMSVFVVRAFVRLRDAGADVTGLNCHFGPTIAEKLLQELTVREGDLVSVFPNAGRPLYFEGRYIYHPTPQYFADFLPRLVAQGARLIGGCCGTTPQHIAQIAQRVARYQPRCCRTRLFCDLQAA